jgi:hypothetical protein
MHWQQCQPDLELAEDVSLDAAELPYWKQAREPLACLVFLLPILCLYEAGVLWLHSDTQPSIRNGADFWMRSWLQGAGLDAFVLPVLIVGILLVWHRYGRYPWRITRETLVGMFAESLLLAVALLFVAQLQDMAFQCWFPSAVSIRDQDAGERPLLDVGDVSAPASTSVPASTTAPPQAAIRSSLGRRLISYLGAGVYEEVMFRLALLPMIVLMFRSLWMPKLWAAGLGVFLTSLAFSVAHYLGPAGESFSLFSFTFRTTAGCFFATVFLTRGFGITVGCHALYDVLVGLLTA